MIALQTASKLTNAREDAKSHSRGNSKPTAIKLYLVKMPLKLVSSFALPEKLI
jgi:hypothetical protein